MKPQIQTTNTEETENFIRYKGKGEHSVNELEKIIEQREDELHQLKAKPLVYFEGTAQGNHTQGEILMKFLNSDAVEIYSITPKHRTICVLKCHDVNGVQVFTYEELKANAQRIVKAVNMHDELLNALKECSRFNKAVTKVDGTILGGEDEFYEHYKRVEQLLKQIEGK